MYAEELAIGRDDIAKGSITFDSLHLLYKPGSIVSSITSLGVPSAFRVVQSWYQQHRSLFGIEKSFHVELQFVISLGTEFAASQWYGAANKYIQDLPLVPLDDLAKERSEVVGQQYLKWSTGKIRFLQHDASSVFLHSSSSTSSLAPSSSKPKSGALHSSGRIMIDLAKASQLGINASQGMDDASLAMNELIKRYRRFLNEKRGQSTASPDNILTLQTIPSELMAICWPALTGFSFTAKSWCHVLVSGLSEIEFNEKAFDQLVLDIDRKQLIRALVKFGSGTDSDIIQGKGGGSIFLLHGPAGVGKTLTAEAIAEVLHRPLYYVTMGELGITPETMENRLESILDLCSSWDAITLIDEAEVFLEKRATSDVLRNAMVCVMLRLLEYHQGILILTTNRVTEFDPAFESRVTVALKYESLDYPSRQKVWKNLLSRLKYPQSSSIDVLELAKHQLNGRQIKNAVRLALALAADTDQPLDQSFCMKALNAANLGRDAMSTAEKW